ncbi:hypothetical protein ABZ897_62195 [Nonomuraea sp. NPDC046802]|uniref:hypothetical protein n=1 Tax=Nonomuraea sp. NPDC046802 TaxID=3154919 RepID=UPI0033F5B9D2
MRLGEYYDNGRIVQGQSFRRVVEALNRNVMALNRQLDFVQDMYYSHPAATLDQSVRRTVDSAWRDVARQVEDAARSAPGFVV